MRSLSNVAVVIDDEADVRAVLTAILEPAGFSVHSAGTGIDGIKLLRQHSPVVTTLDLSMPGIDGFETAKRIREFSDTYLLMLTASTSEIDLLQGYQCGVDSYMTKPFRSGELRARVEAMLRRPRTSPDEGRSVLARADEYAPHPKGDAGHTPVRLATPVRDGGGSLRSHRLS